MAEILLVDDEPTVRFVLAHVLKRYGHRVVEADGGSAALREAAGRAFDLVVTDLVMPDIDGIEVIVRLAETQPGLPVIAISGGGLFPKELLLANADCLGAVVCLPKPFDVRELVEAVRRSLDSDAAGRGAVVEG